MDYKPQYKNSLKKLDGLLKDMLGFYFPFPLQYLKLHNYRTTSSSFVVQSGVVALQRLQQKDPSLIPTTGACLYGD